MPSWTYSAEVRADNALIEALVSEGTVKREKRQYIRRPQVTAGAKTAEENTTQRSKLCAELQDQLSPVQ
ncbi:Hypothetical predicted protein, partial [Pelobates cultripes]